MKKICIIILLFVSMVCHAEVMEYNLTIADQTVNITGKPVQGITVNGTIPGPTLYFKEGDVARIHVHNTMLVPSSIHWHGMLVPPAMDGVPYLSFPPIAPGATFTYEFPIRQQGTYWYHSHSDLQEQSGLYGGIVIAPRHGEVQSEVQQDHVIVLSDWTDQDPHEVMRTLKRGSNWYSIAKGSSQTIFGAARLGMLSDYINTSLRRMLSAGIADVAYDRFLANGQPEYHIPAEANEVIQLRMIDGSASTYFYLEFAGGPMTIIAADGQAVEPVEEQRFLIAVAETYDVLITVPANGAYELRATAQDGSGYTSIWVGQGERHAAAHIPNANLYIAHKPSLAEAFAITPQGAVGMPDIAVDAGLFDQPGGAMRMQQQTHQVHNAEQAMLPNSGRTCPPGVSNCFGSDFRPMVSDVSSAQSLAVDGMSTSRPWAPYAKLRATRVTAFAKDKPVKEIRMTLDGDMDRYVWSINNKILSADDIIHIKQGEVVRFILINRTMMHHPMHLHGHFFRVINEHGDYSPLKHTVDVAPMSTTVIEFDANAVGDWFFHCHILYHLKSGMARVVHYEEFVPSPQVAAVRQDLYRDAWYLFSTANVLSNMTDGFVTLTNTKNSFTLGWEVGWQGVDPTEYELLVTWDRHINRFFSIFAGADIGSVEQVGRNRGVVGFSYLLPLTIQSQTFVGTDGSARVALAKDFNLTPRFILTTTGHYDTNSAWEGTVSLAYTITQYFSLVAQYNTDYSVGGGVKLSF